MPLTKEQFDKLDKQGFSPEEIASFEQRRLAEQPEGKPQIERQNIIGQTFNVPGATSRAAIRSNPALAAAGPLAGLLAMVGGGGQGAQQAAGEGALNPSGVQTFQDQAIQAGQNAGGGPSTSVAVNFAKGLIPSAAGLAADMATDPTSVLMSLIGLPGRVKSTAQLVDRPFAKAVGGAVKGAKNYRGVAAAKTSARSAVESIVDNKNDLKFVDETGSAIEGQLPKNLDEFSQAISQTKKGIFKQYDAIQKEAGEAGAKVPLRPISDEILNAVSSPQIEDFSPSVQKYGMELAQRLEKRGTYSLQEAQDTIEALNNKLKGYFLNPTPDALHQAVIDRAVVNNLRNSMIKAVEKQSGPKYDILRKQYGHLNAVEEKVTKAALRSDGKKVGEIDQMFSAVSAGHIVKGIVTMNPGLVTKGVFQSAVKAISNRLVNPNNVVKNMFRNVDQIRNIDPAKRHLQMILKKVSRGVATGSAEALTPAPNSPSIQSADMPQ